MPSERPEQHRIVRLTPEGLAMIESHLLPDGTVDKAALVVELMASPNKITADQAIDAVELMCVMYAYRKRGGS
jgi:hypothetical protein